MGMDSKFKRLDTTNTKLAAVLRVKFSGAVLVEGVTGPDEEGRVSFTLAYPEGLEEEVKKSKERFEKRQPPESLMIGAIDEYRQLKRLVRALTKEEG